MQELLYTSAPKGLKPGSRGFCTVLSSSGMPAPVATALEGLSAYRPVFPPGDPQAKLNPVVSSHILLSLVGQRRHVLSRIADHGLDYSQRTNKLAHHVVLEREDRPAAGPGWFLGSSGLMRSDWDGVPRVVQNERVIHPEEIQPKVCQKWKDMTGDAGWGGVLAEAFLADPSRLVYIIFEPGMELLPLIEESIALLPTEKRWDVTFSTYFTKLPKGAVCQCRCVLAGSSEANESRRHVNALRIDLSQEPGVATGGVYVTAARTGELPLDSAPVAPLAEGKVSDENNSEAGPPSIKIAQDNSPPPKPIPPSRRRQNRKRKAQKSNVGLWGAFFAVLTLLVAVIAILLLNPPENVPQKETVAKNESQEKLDPEGESHTEKTGGEQIDTTGTSGEAGTAGEVNSESHPAPTDANSVESGGSPEGKGSTDEPPSENGGGEGNSEEGKKEDENKDEQKKPTVTYWQPKLSLLEQSEKYQVGSIPIKLKVKSLKVLIPYDLREKYQFVKQTMRQRKPQTIGQESVEFEDLFSIAEESQSESSEPEFLPISITPHRRIKVEDLNRFVVEVKHPDDIENSYMFLRREEPRPKDVDNTLIAAVSLPQQFESKSDFSSEELSHMFRLRKLQVMFDGELIELDHANVNRFALSPINKGFLIPVNFSSAVFAKRKLDHSPVIDNFTGKSDDFHLEIITRMKGNVADTVKVSEAGQPAIVINVPQLELFLKKRMNLDNFQERIISAALSFNSIVALKENDDVTSHVKEFISDKNRLSYEILAGRVFHDIREFKDSSSANVRVLELFLKENETLDEMQKNKVNVALEGLETIEHYLTSADEILKRIKKDPSLKLKGIVIMQKSSTDGDNEWSMPLVISDAELLQESDGGPND